MYVWSAAHDVAQCSPQIPRQSVQLWTVIAAIRPIVEYGSAHMRKL